MQISNIQNNRQNFGWNYETHKKITELALKQVPEMKEIGMALHYLQDMTVPMHTKRESFAKKILDYYLHINFEMGKRMGALKRQDLLAENYIPQSVGHRVMFDDLFLSNVIFSRNSALQVRRTNKTDWPDIQQKCFDRAVDSTAAFLKKLLIP
jgi:hypothetical protein